MAYKRKKEEAYLKLWFNRWTLFEPLNMEQRGRVLTALMHKALNREPLQLDQVENLAFYVLSVQMDDDTAHYKELCEKNANNRNGRNSSTIDNDRQPTTTKLDQCDQSTVHRLQSTGNRPKAKESNCADKPRRARFVPPTEQEATAYFAEHGGTAEQAAQFCNYYTARGWTTGKANSPMRDWRAAARNWVLREKNFRNGTTPTQEPPQGRSSWGEYATPTEADEAIRAFEAAHRKE